MSTARIILAALAVAGASLATLPAAAADHPVQIFNNFYTPQQLSIDVGDSVTWEAVDPGHTVTPDDGRADCGGSQTLNAGQTVTCSFTTDETVYYHCQVHAGMFGVIVVGEGTPLPPPGGPSEIVTVCDGCGETGKHDTIGAALGIAKPRARIEVEPGTYDEFLTVAKPGIEIRGLGAAPDEVVIDPPGTQPATVVLAGEDQTLRNVTVSGGDLAGVEVIGAEEATVTGVTLAGNGRFGVWVHDSHGVWVSDATATGHAWGGFGVTDCRACETVLDGVTGAANFAGAYVEDASSVVIKGSTFTGNGAGIVLRTTWLDGESLDANAPQIATHIYGNTITGNTARQTPEPAISPQMPLRTGSGVWIGAGSFNVIERNTIADHLYGVVVTGIIGPSVANRVVGNTVSGSSAADLAWDGIGVNTCFGQNTTPGGGEPTAEPVLAQTIYDCALPVTVGVPYPPIALTLADWDLI